MQRVFRSIIPAFLLIFSLGASPLWSQEPDLEEKIQGKETELQKLRNEIARQRKNILAVEKREKNEREYLEKLKKEEELTGKLLRGLEEKGQMLQQQVEELGNSLAVNEKVYKHRIEVLSQRLREIYKDGPQHAWQELLAAEDVSDLLQRYKFLSLIAERDADLVSDVRRRKAQIETQEAEITELLYQVTLSRNEKEEELRRLEENESKRLGTLSTLQADKKRYEKKMEELAQAEKQLQNFIADLEKARLERAKAWGDYGESNFLGLKGKMDRPVEGPITRPFGQFRHPEFGTVTYNTGVDIGTRRGGPVRAVARGRVEYSGVLPGYGNCIIINHGGGYYTLYAHTADIFAEQGSQVEKGGLIAEAGFESAGEGASLHFEIRKSKKALDPGEWLKKGEQ
ncbi:MAG: peptidoglycan DD-metalloendopeptidase family protein [Candidatus Krumholzibacteriota bacterium]|nr:peptidoglycan DD-metalloendopeptidase family protein [Candidatus Krumholzibacteriota bacterium]